jgi:hypothetical protein
MEKGKAADYLKLYFLVPKNELPHLIGSGYVADYRYLRFPFAENQRPQCFLQLLLHLQEAPIEQLLPRYLRW